jgi:hypothetical protein
LTVSATPSATVLRFGGHRVPRALRRLPVVRVDGDGAAMSAAAVDEVTATSARVIVIGTHADLGIVLTRLLRTDRLHVEVAHIAGRRGARRAADGPAQRVPLIRDDTGQVLAGAAHWLAPHDAPVIEGEAVVDDTVLFDGTATGVRIEPLARPPGLRAAVLGPRGRPREWVAGRAAQLGTTGARVLRDGVEAPRPVRRSTFYRHTEGWLRVH